MFKINILILLLTFLVISCSNPQNQKDKNINIIEKQDETSKTDVRDKLKKVYTSQVGIREVGSNRGKDILKYQKSAGIKTGMAWCGSFVYWSFIESGISINVKNPALANNWFIDKNKIIVVRGNIKRMGAQPGDVIGVSYSKNERVNHVGFYDSENDKFYLTVEGNVGGEKSDPGEGVYRLKRIKRQVLYISNYIDI